MKKVVFFSLMCIALILASCGGPATPEFKNMKDVKFKSFSLNGGSPSIVLKANAIFNNPNPFGADVSEVDLDVYINGVKVTHINQDLSAKMPASSDFTLPLSFDVPLQEVAKDFKPTMGDIFKKKKVEYKLEGTLKVGLAGANIKVPVEYEDVEELSLR